MSSMEILQFRFQFSLELLFKRIWMIAKELPSAVAEEVKHFWSNRDNRLAVLFWFVGVPLALSWVGLMIAYVSMIGA